MPTWPGDVLAAPRDGTLPLTTYPLTIYRGQMTSLLAERRLGKRGKTQFTVTYCRKLRPYEVSLTVFYRQTWSNRCVRWLTVVS